MTHNVKFSLSKKTTLVCLNCGRQYEVGSYWIQHFANGGGNMACTICGASNQWRKKEFCTPTQLENSTWKKIYYVRNKEKFRTGRWKLNSRYKKFYDKIEDYDVKDQVALKQKVGENVYEKDEEETE